MCNKILGFILYIFLTCLTALAADTKLLLEGQEGLVAETVMSTKNMPKRILGVGVSSKGSVFVTETVRQMREDISLIQSGYLHEMDMGLTTVAEKRAWVRKNYVLKNIAKSQGMRDLVAFLATL
jgi:hypothetical protein